MTFGPGRGHKGEKSKERDAPSFSKELKRLGSLLAKMERGKPGPPGQGKDKDRGAPYLYFSKELKRLGIEKKRAIEARHGAPPIAARRLELFELFKFMFKCSR